MAGDDVYLGTSSDAGGRLGLMLFQDRKTRKEIRSVWVPADPARAGSAPEDEVYSDWSNGFGYSQPGIVSNGYAYVIGMDASSPGMLIPAGEITEVSLAALTATPGEITDSFSLGGHYYLLGGRQAIKVLSGYSTISTSTDLGSPSITFDKVAVARYSGTTYAWVGRTNGFAKFDGTTWTQTTSFTRGKIGSVYWTTDDGVSVQRLLATDTTTSVVHEALSTDPMTGGNWSASITVGEGAYAVGQIVTVKRHAYVSTAGGLYDIDDLLETLALTPYYQDDFDSNNGLACLFWDGGVLYGAANDIDFVDVSQEGVRHDVANSAMPGAALGIPNETPIWGRPTAWTSGQGWVYVALFNGTDSYIMKGKRRARIGIDGPGEWIWHGALAKYANQRVSHLKMRTVTQSGVTSRRLWTATVPADGTAGTRLFWQSVPKAPTAKQDLDLAGPHRFATGFEITMTPRDWRAPSRQKTAIRADAATRSLGSPSNALTFYLGEDSTTSFGSALGTFTTSPKQAVAFASSAPEGQQLTPKIVGVGSNTTPPQIMSLTIRAAVDHELVEMFEMDVWFSRELTLAHGGADAHAQPETDYRRLAAFQNTVTTFTDRLGTTYTVLVEPSIGGSELEIEQDEDGTRGWGRRVQVRMRVLERQARYDAGELYDLVSLYG